MNVPDLLFWGGVGGVILYGLTQALKIRSQRGDETAGKGRGGRSSGDVIHETDRYQESEGRWIGGGSNGGTQGSYAGELFELRQRIAQVERSFDEFNAEITRRLNRINARRRGNPSDGEGRSDEGSVQTDAFGPASGSTDDNPRGRKAAIRLRARQKVHGQINPNLILRRNPETNLSELIKRG